MEINERDGKFFLKLSNGELELTEKQVQSMVERGAIIRNNFRNWVETFNYLKLPVSMVPNIADVYIKADEFYNTLMHELEELYMAAGSKTHTGERIMEFCTDQVKKLKKELEKSKEPLFIEYQLVCWLRVITFIKSLTHVAAPSISELAK